MNGKRILLSTLLIFLFLFVLSADYSHLLKYETFTLDNGLQVYLVPKSDLPLVSIWLASKTGAYTQTKDTFGYVHIFEHMFFKANKNMKTAEEYYETLKHLGIYYNGYTSQEYVVYYYTFPEYLLEPAAKLAHDSIVYTALDPAELEREKKVIEEEYNIRVSDPEYYLVNKLMAQALYQDQLFRFDPLGELDTIRSASIEKLAEIKENFFIPKNSAIFLVGNIDIEKTKTLVSQLFSDWKGKEPVKIAVEPVKSLDKDVVVFNYMNNPYIAKMYIMLNGPGNSDPEGKKLGYAADVLLASLSNQNHPFSKEMLKYVYNFDFYYDTCQFDGPIIFSAQLPVNQVASAYNTFKKCWNKVVNDRSYWDNSYIEQAKQSYAISQIKLNQYKDLETIGHVVSRLWCLNMFPEALDLYYAYNEIKREDIAAFIDKYFKGKHWVAGILINKAKSNSFGYEKLLQP